MKRKQQAGEGRRGRAPGWRRRAAVVVKVAIMLPVIAGFAALGVEMTMLQAVQADLQRAADAAALGVTNWMTHANGSVTVNQASALAIAQDMVNRNPVANATVTLDTSDLTLGRASFSPSTGGFSWSGSASVAPNAAQVTVRRTSNSPSGPIPLLFARLIGRTSADVSATARSALIPRDIALVVDLSGSMNDDSELKHYKAHPSDSGGTNPGTQINLKDIWINLPKGKGNNGVGNGADPPPPGNPGNQNDQPGTGPGSPNSQGGNPNPGAEPPGGTTDPAGPRWGWMTGWGTALTLGAYNPTVDSGLYYIPSGSSTTQADIIANLTEAGYSSAERAALLSGQYDGSATEYRNRVQVLTGLAGWRSKKSGGKYNGGPGNGDNHINSNELTHAASWPFDEGSWTEYIDYVRANDTEMVETDSNLRYRYGLKTITNYLLEDNSSNDQTPELLNTPEQPLQAVKDSVGEVVTYLTTLDSFDQLSLETFATTARHELNLTITHSQVHSKLTQRQSNHFDNNTNTGGGINEAIKELQSSRARAGTTKVIFLLSDGRANVGSNGSSSYTAGRSYAIQKATQAANAGMTIHAVGVGADADMDLLNEIVQIGHGSAFHATGSIDDYREQLREAFRTLGGDRQSILIR